MNLDPKKVVVRKNLMIKGQNKKRHQKPKIRLFSV